MGWYNKPTQLVDIGFDYGIDDPQLLTAFEMNLFRFSASKTLAEAQELNRLFRESKSFEEFYRAAVQQTDLFNKKWLQTEYDTAYLTGEAAATYTRLKAQVETFPYWEYKTVGDNKVRHEHQILNGLILPANDPRWMKIFPPNGWNCRCYIVPRMRHEVRNVDLDLMRKRVDNYFDTAEFKTAKAQGWGVNRADIGEIFTANQFYINKFPGKASAKLDKIGHSDYGLPSYSNAKKSATSNIVDFEDAPETFIKQQEFFNGHPVIRDYHNRPVSIQEKEFTDHTTNKRVDRVKFLNGLKETISSPDEVWISRYKDSDYNNFVSIKYYKNATMIVVSKIENGTVYRLNTWFPLAERKDVINRYRQGLLIYSKK